MQDGIIKGTGNSRYLKTVAEALTLYPTYEAFMEAFVSGTLPVDLNGINAAGWTQLGTALNKENLLKDATAGLFGLDSTAVPDDVFQLIPHLIPSPYGIIAFRATDASGNPVEDFFTVSPALVDGSEVKTDASGWYRGYAEAGAYTIAPSSVSVFTEKTPSQLTANVVIGQVAVAGAFTIQNLEAGEMQITSSQEFEIPEWLTDMDLFGVGGGGGGSVAWATSYQYSAGGGGGYTATLLAQNLGGKRLSISIGAGGRAPTVSSGAASAGGTGGDTTISADGTAILTAAGGKGGSKVSGNACHGGDGGSGGGGSSSGGFGAGGSDGSNGIGGSYPGTGQGTTTRAFGESAGTLYSSGGNASGGANGSAYGDGGSGRVGSGTSGAGVQGIVRLRWRKST